MTNKENEMSEAQKENAESGEVFVVKPTQTGKAEEQRAQQQELGLAGDTPLVGRKEVEADE